MRGVDFMDPPLSSSTGAVNCADKAHYSPKNSRGNCAEKFNKLIIRNNLTSVELKAVIVNSPPILDGIRQTVKKILFPVHRSNNAQHHYERHDFPRSVEQYKDSVCVCLCVCVCVCGGESVLFLSFRFPVVRQNSISCRSLVLTDSSGSMMIHS